MKYLYIGKIVNTHGIKGELRIISKFPYKDKVFKKGMAIYINKITKEVINTYRQHKNFDMITLEGYDNINDVLKYKGKSVFVNSDDIILDKGKYLDEDLVNLLVIVNNGEMGKIEKIERYDKVALFIIKKGKKEYKVPYHSDLIEKIDMEKQVIYIKDIQGLFE